MNKGQESENGWIEKYQQLNPKVQEAISNLYGSISALPEGFYQGMTIKRLLIGNLPVGMAAKVILNFEELQDAPIEVRRIFANLGVINEQELEMIVETTDTVLTWRLKPKVIAAENVGITFSTSGQIQVMGLLSGRIIEATHPNQFAGKYTYVRTGNKSKLMIIGGNKRAFNVLQFYGFDIGKKDGVCHPYMVDIIYAGAGWISAVVNSRVARSNNNPLRF